MPDEKVTYAGTLLFQENKNNPLLYHGEGVTGTIREVANWADNIIRAQGDDRDDMFIRIHRMKEETGTRGNGT